MNLLTRRGPVWEWETQVPKVPLSIESSSPLSQWDPVPLRSCLNHPLSENRGSVYKTYVISTEDVQGGVVLTRNQWRFTGRVRIG